MGTIRNILEVLDQVEGGLYITEAIAAATASPPHCVGKFLEHDSSGQGGPPPCDTFSLAYNVTMHRKSWGPVLCIMSMSTVLLWRQTSSMTPAMMIQTT
jgi:hypothetical protein